MKLTVELLTLLLQPDKKHHILAWNQFKSGEDGVDDIYKKDL